MLRKNIVAILCCTAALTLTLGIGCKKKKAEPKSSAPAGMTAAPVKSMDVPAPMGMTPKSAMTVGTPAVMGTTPAVATKPGRVGAMPIPADMPIFHINIKAAKATALYKKYEPKLKAALTKAMAGGKGKVFQGMIKQCKLDPMTVIDGVTFSKPLDSKKEDDMILLVTGTFDAPKLIECMKPVMTANKIVFKDRTVGTKKGYTITVDKENVLVLPLGNNGFGMFGGPMAERAIGVLSGKEQSIEDSALYKTVAATVNAKTVMQILVPKIPAALTAKLPMPILKDIQAATVTLSLPGGGLDFQAGILIGDNAKAQKLARALPMLLNIVKAKLGAVGAQVTQNLKVTADAGWVRIALKLDQATFAKVQGLLTGMFK